IPAYRDFARAFGQPLDAVERALHLFAAPHDTHQVLHHVLQLLLDLVWPLALRVALEEGERPALRFLHLAVVDRSRAVIFRELRRMLSGELAEYQQIGERIAPQPVRAV